MKKLFLFLFVALFSLGFVACSDDDDVYYVTETDVNGVYLGSMDVDAPYGGAQLGAEGVKQKIYVTKTGENLVKLQLKNFEFKGIPVGDIEVDQVAVSKEKDDFILNGNGKLTLIVGGCDVNVTGKIDASGNCVVVIGVNVIEKGELDFVGLKVTVDFTGKRLSSDLSSEALITNFDFNNDSVVQVVIGDGSIQYYVKENTTDLKFSPTIAVSAGATVTPASGVEQDFSSDVTYTVVSEDGIVSKIYTVSMVGKETNWDFEEWKTATNKKYSMPVGTFGSTNDGIQTINDIVEQLSMVPGATVADYCVNPLDDAKSGAKAVEIKTVSLESQKNTLYTFAEMVGDEGAFFKYIADVAPYNTAGSFFLGSFKINTDNTLLSTKFGVPFIGKPVKFSGWYKYTSGSELRDQNNEVVAGQKDKCAIYAVLYEAKDENNEEVTLTGVDINTSEYVVLKAALADGSDKADWTKFELDFEEMNGKQYSSEKEYKLAFVCTSSVDGDRFIAAPGSVLVIDDLKIESTLEE